MNKIEPVVCEFNGHVHEITFAVGPHCVPSARLRRAGPSFALCGYGGRMRERARGKARPEYYGGAFRCLEVLTFKFGRAAGVVFGGFF